MSQREPLQSISSDSLVTVSGGDGNPGLCFDHVAAWGVPAAAGGAYFANVPGAVVVGGTAALSAYLDSPDCGDGTRSPMTQLRDFTFNSGRGDTSFNYMGEQTP
jgi:hypothetical protein